ncbi:MAG TPA: hypothetical protein DDX75_06195 [Phycisphaerales bacterium]|nr:hypothetical protein [Phycisphaerales bacterium]
MTRKSLFFAVPVFFLIIQCGYTQDADNYITRVDFELCEDGRKVLSKSDIRFRLGDMGAIDSFLFSTFHGGNTQDWAPDVNSFASFDEFLISKQKPDVLHDKKMKYKVKKTAGAVKLNGNWDEGQWAKANILEIQNYMGEKPKHFPKTQAKLLYDSNNIYVFFKVEDNYVCSAAQQTHGPVWRDSCVEFFFAPDTNQKDVYFNLETNCGGTMYFRYNDLQNDIKKLVEISDCKKIEVYHSLPKLIQEEITTPTVWYVSYRLPLSIISKYGKIQKPESGVFWNANFYKCADLSSHPHWLTWSPVDYPTPNFHLPQYFGILEFK